MVELKCELRRYDARAHILNHNAILPHSSAVFLGIENIKNYIYIHTHTYVYTQLLILSDISNCIYVHMCVCVYMSDISKSLCTVTLKTIFKESD